MNVEKTTLIFTCISLLCWLACLQALWSYWNQRMALKQRLQVGEFSAETKKEESFREALSSTLIENAEKFSPTGKRLLGFLKNDKLERMLALSGYPGNINSDIFLGIPLVLIVPGLIFCNIFFLMGLPVLFLLILLLGLCFGGPFVWLKMLSKRRQEEIDTSLPEFLDAMSVTLQAGVPMDIALQKITSRLKGALKEEINQMNHELSLGVPREEAYQRLSERNDSRDLDTLINSLLHGSKLGVPVSHTFKVMAEDMRNKRINRIKEKAQKASPKVTLVTAFVIVPVVLLAVIGLLFLNIFFNPGALGLDHIL